MVIGIYHASAEVWYLYHSVFLTVAETAEETTLSAKGSNYDGIVGCCYSLKTPG